MFAKIPLGGGGERNPYQLIDYNIFGSIPKSNFWCFFDIFLDLVFFAYFNAISIDFYAVKCFICINYV